MQNICLLSQLSFFQVNDSDLYTCMEKVKDDDIAHYNELPLKAMVDFVTINSYQETADEDFNSVTSSSRLVSLD